MSTVRRVGAFLEVLDEEGCRHLLRLTAIQAISDTDPLKNETLIIAAGRAVRVPRALDEIVVMLADTPRGGAHWMRRPAEGRGAVA